MMDSQNNFPISIYSLDGGEFLGTATTLAQAMALYESDCQNKTGKPLAYLTKQTIKALLPFQ